jgi:HEAT repeat protein
MGEAATPAASAVIPQLLEHVYEAYGALASMTPAVVAREMVSGLEDPKLRAQMLECFHKLAVHGPSPNGVPRAFVEELREIAVEPLIAQLAHEKVRRSAVPFALGLVGANDDRAFATLVGLVDDKDHHVRWSTAHGLKYFGDRAVPHLEKLLDDFGEADTTAVRVLATIGTKPALAVLAKAAKRNDRVGRKAEDELGTIRAEEARSRKAEPRARPATKTKNNTKNKTKTNTKKTTKKKTKTNTNTKKTTKKTTTKR